MTNVFFAHLLNSSLFQISTSTKTKSTAWFLKARKLQILQSLFCVEICSRYRPPFWIGVSEKYFKPNLKMRCDTTGLHLNLSTCPKQPLFEVGATPRNMSTSTLDYPNNMYPSAFGNSESYVGKGSYEIPYTISKPSCSFIIEFVSSPI